MKRIAYGTLALCTVLALSGCQSTANGTPGAAGPSEPAAAPTTEVAEPKTVEAAKALAQKEFDLYAAGDWAGTWDLWTKAGQAAVSREDYERFHEKCHTITGINFEMTNARLEGADKAVVTFKRLIASGKATIVYEAGQWRYQPTDDAMKDYRRGLDVVLKERLADGSCTSK